MNNQYTFLADKYDLLTDDIDYRSWGKYISSLLNDYSCSSVIEAGCGTGNITFELIENGFSVIPFDISIDMLSVAKNKAVERGLDVMFICQDMSEMEMPESDAVVCACDGTNYLESGQLKSFMHSSFKALKKGGVLLFDMSSEHKIRDILGNNVFYVDRDDMFMFWTNQYDPAQNKCVIELSFFIKTDDGKYVREDERQEQYAYPSETILQYLKDAGFSNVYCYEFLTKNESDGKNCDRVQYVAVK